MLIQVCNFTIYRCPFLLMPSKSWSTPDSEKEHVLSRFRVYDTHDRVLLSLPIDVFSSFWHADKHDHICIGTFGSGMRGIVLSYILSESSDERRTTRARSHYP